MLVQYAYRDLKFDVPNLSNKGTSFTPKERLTFVSKTSTKETWDQDHFSKPGALKNFGTVSNPESFSVRNNVRILDMPIKLPGSDIYRVPSCCLQWLPAIKQIASLEHSTNPEIDFYHAYLTIDQGWVSPGSTQRNKGCHVDGFQSARIEEKTFLNRSYVISDILPTVFYNQGFQVSKLNSKKHDFFVEMDLQAKEENAWCPKPYEIVLMNAYNVHRAQFADKLIYRTFFRISYDVKIFDRLGNTHNPMFDYNWKMIPRDVHETLENYR